MRIVSSIHSVPPCAMAQNERIHRNHQSSAMYTSTHLAPPISALSSVQAVSAHLATPISGEALSISQAGTPCLSFLTAEKRAGNKRPCEDLSQDAYEHKRRQRGFAAENGANPSIGLELFGRTHRKSGEMEGLKISNAFFQSRSPFTQEENLKPSLRAASKVEHGSTIGLDGRSADNAGSILQEHSRKWLHTHLQHARMPLQSEKMLAVGLHNHSLPKLGIDGSSKDPPVIQEVINSRGNREKSFVWPDVDRTCSGRKGKISDIPSFLPSTLAEKKTLASQEEDVVSTPSRAYRGKQSSPCQAQLGKQSTPTSSKPKSKVLVDVTNKFQLTATPDAKKHMEEEDTYRLSQRHKQIEFGKNTLGYERYLELVPRSKRKGKDPRTPNPKQVCSKRSWGGQIRKWRRLLHDYDPPAEDGEELAEDLTLSKSKRMNDKLELRTDDIDPKKPLSRPREITPGGATGRMAADDDGLSIYDDWMEY